MVRLSVTRYVRMVHLLVARYVCCGALVWYRYVRMVHLLVKVHLFGTLVLYRYVCFVSGTPVVVRWGYNVLSLLFRYRDVPFAPLYGLGKVEYTRLFSLV